MWKATCVAVLLMVALVGCADVTGVAPDDEEISIEASVEGAESTFDVAGGTWTFELPAGQEAAAAEEGESGGCESGCGDGTDDEEDPVVVGGYQKTETPTSNADFGMRSAEWVAY